MSFQDDVGEPGSSQKTQNKGRQIVRSLAESLNPDNWKPECLRLLETTIQCEDSAPFREPVDIIDYPVKSYLFFSSPAKVKWIIDLALFFRQSLAISKAWLEILD